MNTEYLVTPIQQQQVERLSATYQTTSSHNFEKNEAGFILVTSKRKKVKRNSYKKQKEEKPYLRTRTLNRNKIYEDIQNYPLSK